MWGRCGPQPSTEGMENGNGDATSALIITSESIIVLLMLLQFLHSILIMSVTTTSITTGSLPILADYEVHHSVADQPESRPETAASSPQPADWPTHHRRMPAYRPVNRDLSYTQRPAGNGHPAEYAFIQIMLHGCWINAVYTPSFCCSFGY